MFESLALNPSHLVAGETESASPWTGVWTLFRSVMESLVAAHAPKDGETAPLLYRFPPL